MDKGSSNKHTGTKMTDVEEEHGGDAEPLEFLGNQRKGAG